MTPEFYIEDAMKALSVFTTKANRALRAIRGEAKELTRMRANCHVDLVTISSMPEIAKIQKIVADRYNVSIDVMSCAARPARYVQPRQLAMYLVRELIDVPLEIVGKAFGGRDHGTVSFACKGVTNRMSIEPAFAREVALVREACRSVVQSKAA
jgi:chromosomal replication initiation ATPase DnaA